jgi:O-antigen/teichoic acid export membrane protein
LSIKRNTLYNIGGALAPLALTLLTVPSYLHAIGEARYGVIALIWLLFGYFGLFDLGLSTATANALARSRGSDPSARAPIFLTSLLTNAGLGLAIGLLVLLIAPVAIARMGNLTPALRAEILAVLPWLAGGVPMVTIGGVLSGVLTAHERFGTTNLIGLIGTATFQVAPLWAAYHIGVDLPSIIPVAIVARLVPVVLTGVAALRLLPIRGARYDRTVLGALLAYGGWVMVTNLIGPILVSVDQFVIAGLLGTGAVAHYSIAYGLAVRLQIVPAALTQTMFPRLSQQSPAEARALAGRAVQAIMLMLATLCVPAILLARPFLSVWINPAFAAQSGPIAEILLISVWINALAFTPFALLQAQGRPDVVARFHLLETPPFLIGLLVGIHYLALPGAALAWALRTLLDAVLLFRASRLPASTFRSLPLTAGALAAAWLAASLQLHPVALLALATLSGAALAGWSIRTDPILRGTATQLLGRFTPARRHRGC